MKQYPTIPLAIVATTLALASLLGSSLARLQEGPDRSSGTADSPVQLPKASELLEAQRQAAESLGRLRVERARELFSAGDSASALAYLARTLRDDPGNRVAAERLVSALTHRSFALPLAEPLQVPGRVLDAVFTDAAQRVVTMLEDHTIQVWDLAARKVVLTLPQVQGAERACLGPRGEWLCAEDYLGRRVGLWEVSTGRPLDPPGAANDLAYAGSHFGAGIGPVERFLWTDPNGRNRLGHQPWELKDGKWTPVTPLGPAMRPFDPSTDGRHIATVAVGNIITNSGVWNFSGGWAKTALARPPQAGRMYGPIFSTDGRFVVALTGEPPADSNATATSPTLPNRRPPMVERNSVTVWDTATGQVRRELPQPGPVKAVQISHDGRRLVVVLEDGRVRGHELSSGRNWEIVSKPTAWVAAGFDPTGHRVLTLAKSRLSVCVWDALSGEPVTEPMSHESPVRFVDFSADGQRIFTVTDGGVARVWEARPGQARVEPLGAESQPIEKAWLAPGGSRVFLAGSTRGYLWDERTGQILGTPLKPGVSEARFSPDSRWLVVGFKDRTVRLLSAETGRVAREFKYPEAFQMIVFRPETRQVILPGTNQTLVTVRGQSYFMPGPNQTLEIWDEQLAHRVLEPVMIQDTGAEFGLNPLDRSLEEILKEKRPRPAAELELSSGGRWLSSWRKPTGPSPAGVPFNPDVTSLQLLDWRTSKQWIDLACTWPFDAIHFTSDEKRCLVAASANFHHFISATVYVYETTSGRVLRQLAFDRTIVAADFTGDGRGIVVCLEGSARHPEAYLIQVWDVESGQLQHEFPTMLAFGPEQVSADRRRLATVAHDATVRVRDLSSGKAMGPPIRPGSVITNALLSSNAARLLTLTSDGHAQLWDSRTGLPLSETLPVGVSPAKVNLSADGQWLLMSSTNGARLWALPQLPLPIPGWLPELAEAVAGVRLTEEMDTEPVPANRFQTLTATLAQPAENSFYGDWRNWFLADRSVRAVAPAAALKVPQYVERRIQEGTEESLREARQLAPTNQGTASQLVR